jgi:hypothetical protein
MPINKGAQQQALLPLPLNFVSKNTTWKVQANQEGFSVTYQLLVYADYVHLMSENHRWPSTRTAGLQPSQKF